MEPKRGLHLLDFPSEVLGNVIDHLIPLQINSPTCIRLMIQDLFPLALSCRKMLKLVLQRLSPCIRSHLIKNQTATLVAPADPNIVKTIFTFSKVLENQRKIELNKLNPSYALSVSNRIDNIDDASWKEIRRKFSMEGIISIRSEHNGYPIRRCWLQIFLACGQFHQLETSFCYVAEMFGNAFCNIYIKQLKFCNRFLPPLRKIFLSDVRTTSAKKLEEELTTLFQNTASTLEELSIFQLLRPMRNALEKTPLPNLKVLHLVEAPEIRRDSVYIMYSNMLNCGDDDTDEEDGYEEDMPVSTIEQLLTTMLSTGTKLTTLSLGFGTLEGHNPHTREYFGGSGQPTNLTACVPFVRNLIITGTYSAKPHVISNLLKYCDRVERIQFQGGSIEFIALVAAIRGEYEFPSNHDQSDEEYNDEIDYQFNSDDDRVEDKTPRLPNLKKISFLNIVDVNMHQTSSEKITLNSPEIAEMIEDYCLECSEYDNSLSKNAIEYLIENCKGLRRLAITVKSDDILNLCHLLRESRNLSDLSVLIIKENDEDDFEHDDTVRFKELINSLLNISSTLKTISLTGCFTLPEECKQLLQKMGKRAKIVHLPLISGKNDSSFSDNGELNLADAKSVLAVMMKNCPNIEQFHFNAYRKEHQEQSFTNFGAIAETIKKSSMFCRQLDCSATFDERKDLLSMMPSLEFFES